MPLNPRPVLRRPRGDEPRRAGLLGLRFGHPAQIVVTGFSAAIAAGTALLLLPLSNAGDEPVTALTALFTATSAVCVTGLVVVDTSTQWSTFGEVVILALIQLGGFGIMTLASVLALVMSRRLSLRTRMIAQAERGALALGEVGNVLRAVAAMTLVIESIAAVLLGLRWWLAYDMPVGRAAYLGLFHSVSAFNNAGFSLFSDSLEGFVGDVWISGIIALAVILGGLGFPVLLELRRTRWAWSRWTLHTRLTMATTGVLLVAGTLAFLAFEWSNPLTLGRLDVETKVLASAFQSTMTRTAGFNSLNFADMRETTWLTTSALMFIGGGSASTAGGIKVTTFALLGFVIWSEVRGDADVNVWDSRASGAAQRQALSVALLGLTAAVVGTVVLLAESDVTMARSLFEAFSAFATVGLSTGITDRLPGNAQLTLIVLMLVGRVGPLTAGAALALRDRSRLYRYPEERPIIG